MRTIYLGVGFLFLACSSSPTDSALSGGETGGASSVGGQGGAGVTGSGTGGSGQVGGSAGQGNAGQGNAGSAVVINDSGVVSREGGTGACASGSVVMPLLSKTAPVFASTGPAVYNGPDKGSDWDYKTAWGPAKMPAWIAYDLSAATMSQREQILVVWNAPHAGGYINDKVEAYAVMPIDYTIEVNSAAGGPTAPTTGWTVVANVKSNMHSTVEHMVALGKNNWVRMNITASSDPTGALAIDLDVYSAPCGASDAWMFMGDSITYMTTSYAFSDLPVLAHAANSSRWPVAIDAALGGTNTTTAMAIIDSTIAGFPGRFVVLAYGTNDHAAELHMETLVQRVIAAGKTPVVPHMPWSQSANIQTDGPLINKQIDALYLKYPAILAGPDLWGAFKDRTDLIPVGDVHPNGPGQEELRKQWAKFIAAVP